MTVSITIAPVSRKFVGTVYACDGSDLPTTQDFGTVQFSGPYETAQTVPATEVTYTIIGKTQCGDDIRRITTRTYSSRAVANWYKYSAIWYIQTPFDGNQAELTASVGYGIDLNSSAAASATVGLTKMPSSTFSTSGTVPLPAHISRPEVYITSIRYFCDEDFTYNANNWVTDQAFPIVVQSGTASSQLTLYYLDVHEVWTYDLV